MKRLVTIKRKGSKEFPYGLKMLLDCSNTNTNLKGDNLNRAIRAFVSEVRSIIDNPEEYLEYALEISKFTSSHDRVHYVIVTATGGPHTQLEVGDLGVRFGFYWWGDKFEVDMTEYHVGKVVKEKLASYLEELYVG